MKDRVPLALAGRSTRRARESASGSFRPARRASWTPSRTLHAPPVCRPRRERAQPDRGSDRVAWRPAKPKASSWATPQPREAGPKAQSHSAPRRMPLRPRCCPLPMPALVITAARAFLWPGRVRVKEHMQGAPPRDVGKLGHKRHIYLYLAGNRVPRWAFRVRMTF